MKIPILRWLFKSRPFMKWHIFWHKHIEQKVPWLHYVLHRIHVALGGEPYRGQ